jgi:endoglucanase
VRAPRHGAMQRPQAMWPRLRGRTHLRASGHDGAREGSGGAPRAGRRVVVALTAVIAGLGVATAVSGPANAAAGCSASYATQSQWATGFVAGVTVTNTGTSALTGWTVTFTFGGNQQVTSFWSASLAQSQETVTASNLGYNGALGTGASTSFGLQGSYSTSDAAPASVTCAPGTTAISPTVVASPSSLSVAQGSTETFAVSLSAAPSATATVTVSRASGDAGLSVRSGATLTFTTANWSTAQNVTIAADASSTGTATITASTAGYTAATVTVAETGGGGTAPQLHVSGSKLVDSGGNQVVLHGMNKSGTEFACVQNAGIFNGPADQASVTAMKGWTHVNAVRVPLNEACWNAESYVPPADSGANYINAIKNYVGLLNSNGIVAILDLHWTDGTYAGTGAGCSDVNATCQKPMPDSAQSVPFWTSVATTFKGNNAVIFDLFNEPYPDQALGGSTTAAWQCLLNGGSACSPGISYPVAGMQALVNAVRSTGAANVIMTGGLTWTNDLTQWLAYEPVDPDHDIVASWHSYNFNGCSTQACWTSQIAPVIAKVPVITGEIGENDCAGTYVNPLTSWLNSESTGYLAWTWNDWSAGCNPVLITDYSGTPTAYGAAYRADLQALP